MTPAEMESIVGGYHGDSFRVLGPHGVRKKGGQSRWEVRAFLPQAESAAVVIGDQAFPMEKLHAEGFFCSVLNGEMRAYRLSANLWDGRTIDFDDPYRFGLQISDSDL